MLDKHIEIRVRTYIPSVPYTARVVIPQETLLCGTIPTRELLVRQFIVVLDKLEKDLGTLAE